MGLKFGLLPMLGKLLTDDHLALSDRLPPGGAAASAAAWPQPLCRPCALAAVGAPVWCSTDASARFVEGEARGMRLFWRVLGKGMMQGGWEARTVALGTVVPACGARGDAPLFAAFARFAVGELQKIGTCRMVLLSRKLLLSCGNGSLDLSRASSTHSDRRFDTVKDYKAGEPFWCNPLTVVLSMG